MHLAGWEIMVKIQLHHLIDQRENQMAEERNFKLVSSSLLLCFNQKTYDNSVSFSNFIFIYAPLSTL